MVPAPVCATVRRCIRCGAIPDDKDTVGINVGHVGDEFALPKCRFEALLCLWNPLPIVSKTTQSCVRTHVSDYPFFRK